MLQIMIFLNKNMLDAVRDKKIIGQISFITCAIFLFVPLNILLITGFRSDINISFKPLLIFFWFVVSN